MHENDEQKREKVIRNQKFWCLFNSRPLGTALYWWKLFMGYNDKLLPLVGYRLLKIGQQIQ